MPGGKEILYLLTSRLFRDKKLHLQHYDFALNKGLFADDFKKCGIQKNGIVQKWTSGNSPKR
jgi:hypothetical protein